MNYTQLTKSLESHDKTRVDIYVSYLKKLETATDKNTKQPKNKWFIYFNDEQAAGLFNKVALDDGMFIDGETITLQFKGAVIVSYNFQAYKNKVLTVYPKSKFDFQLLFDNDKFSFEKRDGAVHYVHKFGDITSTTRKIVGAYGIIKNERGEFIETLNMDDIQKMRNVAKTQSVWNEWFSEMVFKSIIKRTCKRHFNDLVVNIELIDNENYDLEAVSLDSKIQDMIQKCDTLEELEMVYQEYSDKNSDEVQFIAQLTNRKREIKMLQNENS